MAGTTAFGYHHFSRTVVECLTMIAFASAILLSHFLASAEMDVTITETSVSWDNKTVLFDDIIGYSVNRSIFITAFAIKLKSNKVVSINAFDFGKFKETFREFTDELIRAIKAKSINAEKMIYSEMYNRNLKFRIKWHYYVDIPIVIVVNLGFLYFKIIKNVPLEWYKLFFLNVLFLSTFKYLQVRKKKE